jgi:hypothetical protein
VLLTQRATEDCLYRTEKQTEDYWRLSRCDTNCDSGIGCSWICHVSSISTAPASCSLTAEREQRLLCWNCGDATRHDVVQVTNDDRANCIQTLHSAWWVIRDRLCGFDCVTEQTDLDQLMIFGYVEIDINITGVVTDQILLHARNLTISSASIVDITPVAQMTTPAPTIYDDTMTVNMTVAASDSSSAISYVAGDLQYALITFPTLAAATQASHNLFTIQLTYTGALNADDDGFYVSQYTNALGGNEQLAVTHFEPTSARRAFPCFDEPALKATVEVHLRVDTARYPTVLSNEVGDVRGVGCDGEHMFRLRLVERRLPS